jgi:chemotaxis protein CheD
MKRIILNIGELAVSKEAAILETILGSCVAVCLWDEKLRIGGLNHYLLPYEQPNTPKSTVYGATSIETLVKRIIEAGSDVRNLQAQIFGGGSVITDLDNIFNIGVDNVRIAQEKLHEYDIPIVGSHVRATHGIKVVFRTATGEVTVKPLGRVGAHHVSGSESDAFRRQLPPCKACIMCGSCAELTEQRRRGKKG